MTVSPEYEIKRRCDVTADEEYRNGSDAPWLGGHVGSASTHWVEVRPKPDIDPDGVAYFSAEGRYVIVTTSGHMKARKDLWRWEVADPTLGWRGATPGRLPIEPGFPIMVSRRKK